MCILYSYCIEYLPLHIPIEHYGKCINFNLKHITNVLLTVPGFSFLSAL